MKKKKMARNDAQGLVRAIFSSINSFEGYEFTREQVYLHANTTLANTPTTIGVYLQGGYSRPRQQGGDAEGFSFQQGTGTFNRQLLFTYGFRVNDARYFFALDTPISVLNALTNNINGARIIRRVVTVGATHFDTRFGAEQICTNDLTTVTC